MKLFSKVILAITALSFAMGCQSVTKKSGEEGSDLEAVTPTVGASASGAIDPVAITRLIREARTDRNSRESFVNGLVETAHFHLNRQAREKGLSYGYNVLVFNLGNKYTKNFSAHYFDKFTHEKTGITYGVWGFVSGTFENRGEGGYMNWAMYGCHDHKEGEGAKLVTFVKCGNQ